MSNKVTIKSVLFNITERCTVGCSHCGYIGSRRNREANEKEIGKWVDAICAYPITNIIFTGGEPFEAIGSLEEGVKASLRGGAKTSIFTSSNWAKSKDLTIEKLSRVEGISQLYLSTDDYHQKRVPIQNVYNVIDAALKMESVTVSLCITYDSRESLKRIISKYKEYEGRVLFHTEKVIPTQFISPTTYDLALTNLFDPSSFSCSCYLGTPLINPNGDVISCHIGKAGAHSSLNHLPYFLGNLFESEFNEIMDNASTKSAYQFLRTHGPKGIADFIGNNLNLLEVIGRSKFTNGCDLCFSFLRTSEGREALEKHISCSSVKEDINIKLALVYNENTID